MLNLFASLYLVTAQPVTTPAPVLAEPQKIEYIKPGGNGIGIGK